MKSGSYEYQSEFACRYFAQGWQEGFLTAVQQSLFALLDAQGLKVDDPARQRILACTDSAQLKLWLRAAVTVRSVQELFER